MVSDDVLWAIIDKLIPLVKDRFTNLSTTGAAYLKSSTSEIEAYDKVTPITVTSTFGSSQTNPIVEKTVISWSKVIGTDLKEEIPLDYGTSTFRSFKRSHQPFAELSPIDDNLIIEFSFEHHFMMMDVKASMWRDNVKPDKALKYLDKLLF